MNHKPEYMTFITLRSDNIQYPFGSKIYYNYIITTKGEGRIVWNTLEYQCFAFGFVTS